VVKIIGKNAALLPHTDGQSYLPDGANVTPSNTCFLGPIQIHIPNGISIGSAIFAQLTAESHYTLQWAAPFPLQNFRVARGIWTSI